MTNHEIIVRPNRLATGLISVLIGIVFLVVSVVGCSSSTIEDRPRNISVEATLSALVLEGAELHELLRTKKIDSVRDLPTGLISPGNPHLSSDDDFVESVSRAGSHGSLGREGMRSALFARYTTGDNELGFYGLRAQSEMDADEREIALREIWADNGSHGRSRVYRKNLILLVIWHNDVPPECWETVNAAVLERLNGPHQNDR